MAKKKNKKRKKKYEEEDDLRDGEEDGYLIWGLKEETLRAVGAVLLVVLAVFFTFASLDMAGVAGSTLYGYLHTLFGLGYFLLPFISLVVGILLMRSMEKKFGWVHLIGVFLFLASGLGIINLFVEGNGGMFGLWISDPLVTLFDFYTSLVILFALMVISVLIIFNTTIKLDSLLDGWRRRRERIQRKRELQEEEYSLYDEEEVEEEIPEKDDSLNNEEEKDDSLNSEEEKKKTWFTLGGEKESEDLPAESKIDLKEGALHTYNPPPLSLLKGDSGKPGVGDVKANTNIIKRSLHNFGIDVEVDEVSVGPSVTRYALKPAEGVKLSRIVGLQNDLSLALAAHPLRIEAPIPGKSLVGIEIPNKIKSMIGLGSLLSLKEFQSAINPLTVALGKNITGSAHFANIGKMPHCLIAGATGSGKTCGEDTYIFSEKGMLTFKELCPLPLNTEIDYELKVATRDGIETTSKNYNNGICDFYQITTAEGFSIEITAEHPLWTIQDGIPSWQSGGDIKRGGYVAISRGAKLFGTNNDIYYKPKASRAREIKLPKKMTPELGLFIGLLTADGGLTVNDRIVYTQEGEVLDLYIKLLKKLFGMTKFAILKSGSSNLARDVIFSSKQLKDFLKHLDVKSARAEEKEIPQSIRQSGPETIRSFIKGLINNDGCITDKGVEICLSSEKLIKQLHIVLLNFNIIASVHSRKVEGYENNTYWRLTIYGQELEHYAKEIGFLTKEEADKAERLLRKKRNTNRNLIPNLSPSLKKLAQTYLKKFAVVTNRGWSYQENVQVPKYAFNSLRSYNSGVRKPSYGALDKIISFYQPLSSDENYQNLISIRDTNFYWAKVSDIKKTKGVGYDFEVPGSHSFVGNGFVNHNSVMIHSLITSLLYRNSPENLKFIMVDPKRVELTLYKNIPHLLTPVITTPKDSIKALKWAAKEMDRRYDILESEAVRDIDSYHKKILQPERERLKRKIEKGEEIPDDASLPETMPYIVIVIDELADIMASYPREMEAAVVRLAQMSRAVGIHLVISTQRPSVNVITGLIKANIPTRIALQVTSQVDSRTILDASGAERLLGAGDMLYLSGEMSKPHRLQSAFISEDEVKGVVKCIKKSWEGGLDDHINLGESSKNALFESMVDEDDDEDELYGEARQIVVETGKASTSYLQRRLRVGYARAGRLIDMLEQRGVIGPGDGAKPREVYEKPLENNTSVDRDEDDEEENDQNPQDERYDEEKE